jgi:hypothetical protein
VEPGAGNADVTGVKIGQLPPYSSFHRGIDMLFALKGFSGYHFPMKTQPVKEDYTKALSPNFWFLSRLDSFLFKCANEAERLIYFDPHAALFKMRLLGEFTAKRIAAAANLSLWGDETDRAPKNWST